MLASVLGEKEHLNKHMQVNISLEIQVLLSLIHQRYEKDRKKGK